MKDVRSFLHSVNRIQPKGWADSASLRPTCFYFICDIIRSGG